MGKFNASAFNGVYPAMVSCYDSNGKIDTEAVRQLVRFLISSGVNGVYVGGSTGEGLLQSAEERKEVLNAVMEENGGRIQVIAHIGAMTTDESVELAVHAEEAGADAISAVPPFYYHYSERAVKNHWKTIFQAVSLPFIIYHIPSTTGFNLTEKLFKEMIAYPNVAGLKVSSHSSHELQKFKAWGGDNFQVFNGPDGQYLAGRVMGACGGIGATYGAMPELFLRIERSYADNDIAGAQFWQIRVNERIAEILKFPLYAAVKEIIRLRGVDSGKPRRPLESLTKEQAEQVAAIKDKIMDDIGVERP